MVEQRLNIDMRQGLVMTPQLQMAIKLLQMSGLDLQTYVETEMLENPFLKSDEAEEVENKPAEQNSQEVDASDKITSGEMENESMDYDWDDMYDSGRGASSQSVASDDDRMSWEQTATKDESLKEHLDAQVGLMTDDPVESFLLNYLIDEIDDAGYLRTTTEEVSQKLVVDIERVESALKLLQTMEPTGVGARDLSECLKLQLEAEGKLSVAAKTLLENLHLLAQQDFKKLTKLAGTERSEIEAACVLIKGLNPKPGLEYGGENAAAVIPDIMVSRDSQGNWTADLNAEAMPKVLVNRGYDNVKAKGDDKSFVSEKKNRAQWLVKSLEQRARSIYKTANAILEMQSDFFDFGVESLKPMTLKEVADKIDVHESTVSRVTTGKYMQTPLGVFELKFFFSSAINTTGGNQTVAAESVKQMIKRLVSEEDKAKPLSDEKLVKMLKAEGVDVARRTVAKYREALGIGSSSERRVRPT